MISLKNFLMKCKQHCHQALSVLDDSEHTETAVETFMKDLEGKKPTDDEPKNETVMEKTTLYTQPDQPFIERDTKEEISDSLEEKTQKMMDETMILNKLDQLLVLCENIPAKIQLTVNPKPKTDENIVTERKEPEVSTNTYSQDDMIGSIVGLIEELDRIDRLAKDENVHSIIDFCQNRMVEILTSHGCQLMEESKEFQSTYHVIHPFKWVNEGTEIRSYVRKGVLYQGKVLLKAIVQV